MHPSDLKPDWSRTSTNNGYVLVFCPDHPNAWSSGYVYAHRLIVELDRNEFLTGEEIVHHMDENRTNNSLANLNVETQSEHARQHHAGTAVAVQLQCWYCNNIFEREARQMHGTNKRVFCKRSCYHEALRSG